MLGLLSFMWLMSAIAGGVLLIMLIVRFVRRKPKKRLAVYLGIDTVICLVLIVVIGINAPPVEPSAVEESSAVTNNETLLAEEPSTDVAAETPIASESSSPSDTVITPSEEPSASPTIMPSPVATPSPIPEPSPTPVEPSADIDWNISDPDALTNGNLPLAVSLQKEMGAATDGAESVEAALVMKAPWEYYGKLLSFSGVVQVVSDYPSGSDASVLLECDASSEIVILADDGQSIVDMFLRSSSGDILVGDTVTLYGNVAGRMEVANQLGGSFTHLAIVGNIAEKN